ncbi:MAG TPA: threonine synthase [Candidatus Methylomirabilis sp.]|nr:threonine synthase [Candidatus Methylomirabilis sp.]HSC71186.1 threonine synthase [Candidatus Methylomirabilis sp.]
MTEKFVLDCAYCGGRHAASYLGMRCERCDGPLVVNTDLGALRAARPPQAILRDPALPGMWSYFSLLPITDRGAVVSLGEGSTPLTRAERLAESLGIDRLYLKDETRNPTGSFKDRMLAVGVARARELGKKTIAVQSSGNVAAAAAAYAARAGLQAKIFVPRTAPEEKLVQVLMYGADLFRIDHDSPTDIFDLLRWACDEFGWYLASTAAIFNPFTLEGAKTIAYEIAEQMGFDLPEWIIVPVGGGGNIGSLWRGFKDLRDLGLMARFPRMLGVQAAGCAPIVEAIRLGRTAQEALTWRWPRIDTVAGAIADDVVFDAHIALPAVRESHGAAVAVTDDETLAMESLLARTEGIFVEPASATALAALKQLLDQGRITRRDRVCCVLTGLGFKDMQTARRLVPPIETLPLSREAIAARVRRQ